MTEILAAFLILALAAYVLFGGADFGGGILEATLPSRALRKQLQATLAPVWEANHVWLIAVVVILFVGFPRFYAAGFTRLFIPISGALLGIVLRGVFFTLRKYDPDPSPQQRRLFSWLFRLSSLLTPLFFGCVVAGMLGVHPGSPKHIPAGLSFAAVYLDPWADSFALVCGLFIAALFAYLAAVFFYAEVELTQRPVVWRRAQALFVVVFLLGGVALALGHLSQRVPLEQAAEPFQLICQGAAAIAIGLLLWSQRVGFIWGMRIAAGAQVLAILGGWFHAQAPTLLRMEHGVLSLSEAAAPPVTQFWLLCGLSGALALVIPLLVWLYRVFAPTQHPLRDRADS